jgi:hypothetical protein
MHALTNQHKNYSTLIAQCQGVETLNFSLFLRARMLMLALVSMLSSHSSRRSAVAGWQRCIPIPSPDYRALRDCRQRHLASG